MLAQISDDARVGATRVLHLDVRTVVSDHCHDRATDIASAHAADFQFEIGFRHCSHRNQQLLECMVA